MRRHFRQTCLLLLSLWSFTAILLRTWSAFTAWSPRNSSSMPHGSSHQKPKAVILALARNSELNALAQTLSQFEMRFNRQFKYPYVFLNDQPFTSEFQDRMKELTKANVTFGLVNEGRYDAFAYPKHLDQRIADLSRMRMREEGVKYGESVAYRHMCRWYSGLFAQHPKLQQYDWYWRIEPGVNFYCDIPYDVFEYMEKNNKVYGFVISLLEMPETVASLWQITREYLRQRRVTNATLLNYFLDRWGNYNMCHFWSNLEIAKLSLWKDPAYLDYFNYLDRWGGFFLERWGDAPVHSLWVGIRLNKDQVHFFKDIGYRHDTITHCVDDGELKATCSCPGNERNFDFHPDSCLPRWYDYRPTLYKI